MGWGLGPRIRHSWEGPPLRWACLQESCEIMSFCSFITLLELLAVLTSVSLNKMYNKM